MNLINGMETVNGGDVRIYEGTPVEVLGPNISGHRTFMVVTYAPEGHLKVSMVYDGNSITVFRYKSYAALQHYWSTNITVEKALKSRKYSKMAKFTIEAYNHIIGR